jgi:hypothetical protein
MIYAGNERKIRNLNTHLFVYFSQKNAVTGLVGLKRIA